MINLGGTDWLTTAEACAQLGGDVTPEMVRDWARRGLVRSVKVGRDAWYPLEGLWEAEHRTRTASRGRVRSAAA